MNTYKVTLHAEGYVKASNQEEAKEKFLADVDEQLSDYLTIEPCRESQ